MRLRNSRGGARARRAPPGCDYFLREPRERALLERELLEREPLERELLERAGLRAGLRADDPLDFDVPERDRLDELFAREDPPERELDRDEPLDRELERRRDELRRSPAGISSVATALVSCGISLPR